MKGLHLTLTTALMAMVYATASAETFFQTGFESPYTLGDLSGQDDWMVTPMSAGGLIQGTVVHSGTQAVELIDGASFGRAQRSVTGTMGQQLLMSSFAMYFDDAWQVDIDADRFEAQVRIEVNGATKGVYGIEFGLVRAPTAGYETVPGDGSAFFIEIGSESAMMAKGYGLIDYASMANAWHVYDLTYDGQNDTATLWVDGIQRTQVFIDEDIASVSNIQLQNQRWGTSPSKNASLFFDDVHTLQAVPEPASLIGLTLGGAALLLKLRKRSR
jgi:hypothetical protein